MLSAENLAAIESEGRRLGLTARRDPDRAVPQYPGWSLSDLVAHTGSIHHRTTTVVTEQPSERIPAPTPPPDIDVIEWYETGLDAMLAALTDADPDTPCWAFGPRQCVGVWETRMVIETGVHRWDAYQAFGEEDRLTDRVAGAGLDEFADMWLPRMAPVAGLEVVADDLGRSWVYGDQPGTTVTGTASDIYLRLMSRPSPVELPDDWAAAVDALGIPAKG